MNLASLSIRRPVATAMLLVMVIVLGVFSLTSIPMDLMPSIELPVAMVMTTYSNSSPEEVENMVTKPVEAALASVEGLEALISYSMEGMSIVAVQFTMDTDMDFASLDMREKIALISDYLPETASEPMVMKLDMNSLPVVQLYITSDTMSLAELNNRIENSVVPYLERASGVASVDVSGGISEEVLIEFNQAEASAYGIDLATISQILMAENINLPAGNINRGSSEIIVRTIGQFESVDDIRNLPVTLGDYSMVRLGDIATVTQHYGDPSSVARIDGETAIGVMISKQSDANTVDVSDAVNKVIKQLEADNPELNFIIGSDSADYIKSSIMSVGESAVMGGILAVLVVFLFLRNVRSTLVIAVSLPTSILAAIAVMNALGITLNIVTLCSLTIVVGMLVDNSIVVLENIFRHRNNYDAHTAAEVGAKEVFLAIIASTATTMIVFVPIAVSKGWASMMFADFCWTIVIALAASLIVALTVVPMLCSKILQGTVSTEYLRIGEKRYKYKFLPKFGEFIIELTEKYEVAVKKVLGRRKKFIVACILIFVLSATLVLTVGFELLPATDEGSISISATFPYGTKLEDKDKVMREIEAEVLALPELSHISVTTDSLSALSFSESSTATVSLVSKEDRRRSTAEIADELQEKFDRITTADVSVSESSSIGSMFGTVDVSFLIKGQDRETLEGIGYDLIDRIETLDIVEHASLDVSEGSPQVLVKIDRTAASYYGITAYQLANSLSTAISGTSSTNLTVDGEEIAVKLSLGDSASASVESMKQIMVSSPIGTQVPVGQIATFEYSNAPSYIQRDNQTNYITLNVYVAGSTGQAQEVISLVDDYLFPEGYYVENSGSYETMMESFGELFKALMIAIALVFLLLAAQFESMLLAFIVMMAVPFAMSGAFLALFITGKALSLTSFLGLIMLVGTVVNNSILLVEFIKQNEEEMGVYDALVQAGKLRLRPILMSCVTTVVGMLPMAFGRGDGGEMLAPMAIAMIGGLMASTLITLFLIPVIYSIIDDRKNKKRNAREEKMARIKLLEEQWAMEDAQ
ncbi:MAG: efflux RND transporter permease subunit [Clostridiales bacterium]|nr:efflux RND transporter permease subunit [Clostridiales bacterium]